MHAMYVPAEINKEGEKTKPKGGVCVREKCTDFDGGCNKLPKTYTQSIKTYMGK